MILDSHVSLQKEDKDGAPDGSEYGGVSFLHQAILHKHNGTLKWLLDFRKHDVMYYCDALRYAVSLQHLDIVRQLIEYGYYNHSAESYPNVNHYALLQALAESWRHYRVSSDKLKYRNSEHIHKALLFGLNKIGVDPSNGKVSVVDHNGTQHTSSFIETSISNLLRTKVSHAVKGIRIPEFCRYLRPHDDMPDNPCILLIIRTLFTNIDTVRNSKEGKDQSYCQQFVMSQFDNFRELFLFCEQRGMTVYPHEEAVLEILDSKYNMDLHTSLALNVIAYLAIGNGFNIQNLTLTKPAEHGKPAIKNSGAFIQELIRCKVAQRIRNLFALSLPAIDYAEFNRKIQSPELYSCRYEHGRTLLHMLALCNRSDIIKRILVSKMPPQFTLWSLDGDGMSILNLAISCGSSNVDRLLRPYFQSAFKIVKFMHNKWSRTVRDAKQQKRQSLVAIVRIQKVYRGFKPRRHFQLFYSSRRDDIAAFHFVWSKLVNALKTVGAVSCDKLQSWQAYKQHYDMLASGSNTTIDTVQSAVESQIQSAIDSVTRSVDNIDVGVNFDSSDSVLRDTISTSTIMSAVCHNISDHFDITKTAAKCDNIELSQSVVKWLQSAESKYRAIFQSRIERLAEGDRSYALSKRLQGCSYPIFETKLDAGMRILWTAVRRNKLSSILVWYVSKHDDVGRLVDNIVTANKRELHSRKIDTATAAPSSSTEEYMDLRDEDILLDPNGNCPLKIYTASRGDIPLLTTKGWAPSLRLDNKQHDACSNSGTTLLLGRSGTGKTVCLSDRMTRDRLLYAMNGQQCNQLFVSRSRRLCELVKSFQQQAIGICINCADFLTLDKFVQQMERAVNGEKGASGRLFPPADRVDYQRFCVLMAGEIKTSSLEAVVLWTQIRSFLKGSLEALLCQLKHNRVLSAEEYCSETKFAPDRCRLSPEQRRKVYSFYQQYQHRMTSEGLWDDADRVLDLLTRSKLQPLSAYNGNHTADYHKVYVDEVQDNTQAEIVLYFLAAGMNTQSLFLAGDPAQSVVEGVDFRFEEVRAIVHELSNGADRIDRPSKLFVNYRSHSGVLNCAAAVLDKLFALFPGSAKVLPRDAGLFKGPRPAYFTANNADNLITLLSRNESIVVLCHDAALSALKQQLNNSSGSTAVNNTMLGIRAAKGMEYKDVLLYDFFGGIPETDHKPWKTLFSMTKLVTDTQAHIYPQIESQLKLLYTAITRSCNRLIFVESAPSSVFSAFCRWMKNNELGQNHSFHLQTVPRC